MPDLRTIFVGRLPLDDLAYPDSEQRWAVDGRRDQGMPQQDSARSPEFVRPSVGLDPGNSLLARPVRGRQPVRFRLSAIPRLTADVATQPARAYCRARRQPGRCAPQVGAS